MALGVASSCCAFGVLAAPAMGQNLIVNPSFEDTTVTGTEFNLPNADFTAAMGAATAFGDRVVSGGTQMGELDIMDSFSGFGPDPIEGLWKVGLAHDVGDLGVDAVSLDLLSPIEAGTLYQLSFAGVSLTSVRPDEAPLQIGISDVPDAFGTAALTTDAIRGGTWQRFSYEFIATTNGDYLTVAGTDGLAAWTHLDDFSLPCATADRVGRQRGRAERVGHITDADLQWSLVGA
ncbi:MAG: hypothetical protein AAFV30_09860, partial [Pseudomonadota bacterium]